jgi:hypothetical protein
LGIDPYDGCWLPLSEVRARCTRRLWDVPRNYDAAETVTVPDGRGGLRIECYREEHTLRKLTQQLLKMIKNRTKEGVEQQFFF